MLIARHPLASSARLGPRLATLAGTTLLAACAATSGHGERQAATEPAPAERGPQAPSRHTIPFGSGQAALPPQAAALLDQVAGILRQDPSRRVLIEGHSDPTGGLALNQELSELRALRVMKALVDRGVAKERITALGLGHARPVASNATPEGRQANRRTDIVILGERGESPDGGPQPVHSGAGGQPPATPSP